MKKVTALISALLLLLSSSLSLHASALSSSTLRLSDLTEEECIDFILDQGVSIPDEFSNIDTLGLFVKTIIALVESNPNYLFAINYKPTLDFANEIRTAVNCYYNVSRNSIITPVRSANYTLQYNTEIGAWNDAYEHFNCYAYALNEYSLFGGEYFYYPGYFSNSPFNIAHLVTTWANNVHNDLESIGYECILATSDYSEAIVLSDDYEIICLRKGNQYGLCDYHFMVLDNGSWNHKPGQTNPLSFLYEPYEYDWFNEYSYKNVAYDGDYYYTSTIYYFAYSWNHVNATYTSNGNDTHTIACAICDQTITSSCTWEYTTYADGFHNRVCVDCGHSIRLSCNMEYSYAGSNYHIGECADCGYSISSTSCTFAYEYNNDNTHTKACTLCGNSSTSSCTMDYLYTGNVNGSNTHKYGCTECGYSAFGSTPCTYKSSDYCSFCGVHKDAIIQTQLKNVHLGC